MDIKNKERSNHPGLWHHLMNVSHRLRGPSCYDAKKKNLWVIPENHKIPPHNNASYVWLHNHIWMITGQYTVHVSYWFGESMCITNTRTNFRKLGFKIVGKDRPKLVKKQKKREIGSC